jgi:deoxyribonuclease IV
MFGSHLSISGGMHNALLEAESLQMDTVQVFTKNQQQWRCKPLSDESITEWKKNLKRLAYKKTVSHDSYLINLASPDDKARQSSINLFIEELNRCRQLNIPFLVTHPGAHLGTGEDPALTRIARSLEEAYAAAGADGVTTCLEITAGQGTSLGYRLEHLAEIISQSKYPKRLAVCLDTAHLFAAGYDFRGRRYTKFRKQIESTVGLKRIKVLHLNDSKKDLGSRVDRHDHIGQGKIGIEGFTPFVGDEAFQSIPKILETPKGKAPNGKDWDTINLETLRRLSEK